MSQTALVPLNKFDLSLLGAVGDLDAYIQAVNRVPMLTPEEELSLAKRLKEFGDLDAAKRLILSHLRLVVSTARQYLGYGIAHADLIQEGNIGLMKAVKRFDHERGVRLVSFAMHWIKAEIHDYILKNWRLVKVATTKAQRKLFFNLRSMKADGQHLTVEDVNNMARVLNVRPEDVREMDTRLSGRDVAIDVQNDDEDDTFAPIAYLNDPSHEPTQIIEAKHTDFLQSEGLSQALAQLDDRSRHIVEARWLAQDDGSGATLHDLAAQYGVSAERIRQIEVKALQKMKTALLPMM